ncbi:MAG: FkbM family methyltransferase [Holosporaceae bacterium]|jgi:FkbM family methyltransferase|nr:FkbM family methyltransferase [Holosporaceae bacterium]
MLKKIRNVTLFSGTQPLIIISLLLCALIIVIFREDREFSPGSWADKYRLSKTNQDLWLLTVKGDYVSENIEFRSVWEVPLTEYLIKNIKPSETVVEVGAHIGYYTTLLAKLVTKSGRVYSYDANGKLVDLNRLSLKMNDLYDIVTLKNAVVADRKKQVNFVFNEPNLGLSHIKSQEEPKIIYASEKKEEQMETISLDEDLLHLKNVDWLRMDIEGSEILVLNGARRIISDSPNIKIIAEWRPHLLQRYGDTRQLISDLRNMGFVFYDIPSPADSYPLSALSNDCLLSQEFGNILIVKPHSIPGAV